MMRKFTMLLLAGCCGWVLAVNAADAPAGTAPAAATVQPATSIPDSQVPRYLSAAQRKDWADAKQKIIDGQKKIADGQFAQIKPSGTDKMIDPNAADNQKFGRTTELAGQVMVREGTVTMTALRTAALANYNKAPVEDKNAAPVDYTMAVGQWPDAIQEMSEKIYGALADANYKRIYLASVYNFDGPRYTPKFELAEQIRQIFVKLDRGKGIFTPPHDWSFRIAEEGGNLTFTYPERADNQKGGVRAAMVIGEILDESDDGFATFSLRAVDLNSWRIIANQTMIFSVEPILGKSLGLPAFQVLSKHETPPAPAAAAAPAASTATATTAAPASTATAAATATAAPAPVAATAYGATITMQEQSSNLAEYRESPRSFTLRFTDAGGATLENRAAVLAMKSFLHDQLPALSLNDYDFLILALASDAPSGATPSANQANTVWQLAGITDLTVSPLEIAFKVRTASGTTDTNLGKIVIQRTLPKLTRPSSEELHAAGYNIGGK